MATMHPPIHIRIAGGGPAGLTLALLLAQGSKLRAHGPLIEVEVQEALPGQGSAGFGVVLSDETQGEVWSRLPGLADRLSPHWVRWDDLWVHHRGQATRCGGHGFAGLGRTVLVQTLRELAQEAGVKLTHGAALEPGWDGEADGEQMRGQALPGVDLLVAADGIQSAWRTALAEDLRPRLTWMRNRFAWMGSTAPLKAFHYHVVETAHGPVVAHAYPYEAHRSTWVFEMDEACWQGLGLHLLDEAASARQLEHLFHSALGGHPLLTHRSHWRRFPALHCERWWTEVGGMPVVLLGDACASAHYTVGSGTKLAMESAMSLADALLAQEVLDAQGILKALALHETRRRAPVEILQHHADSSAQWFERIRDHVALPHMAFAMALMTRSKALTYDELMRRDEAWMRQVDEAWWQRAATEGLQARARRQAGDPLRPLPPMYTPLKLAGLALAHRVVMAPMAQYQADALGRVGDWHLMHYGSHAQGLPAILYGEMTSVSPEGRITQACPGLWNDAQEEAWRRALSLVRRQPEVAFFMQLGHAGRKGSARTPAAGDGPLSASEGAWPLCAASPLPWDEGWPAPQALDEAGMAAVEADFVQAARRALRLDVAGLEVHAAHGYLLAGFLSPLTNVRTDAWGGGVQARLRFPMQVIRAVRSVWPAARPLSVRLSLCDWADGGLNEEDALAIGRAMRDAGVDLVSVSTGQTVAHQQPRHGRMWQMPFAELLKKRLGLRVMGVGAVTTSGQVNALLHAGKADLVALGRPWLADPFWMRRQAALDGVSLPGSPAAYAAGWEQVERQARQPR